MSSRWSGTPAYSYLYLLSLNTHYVSLQPQHPLLPIAQVQEKWCASDVPVYVYVVMKRQRLCGVSFLFMEWRYLAATLNTAATLLAKVPLWKLSAVGLPLA